MVFGDIEELFVTKNDLSGEIFESKQLVANFSGLLKFGCFR